MQILKWVVVTMTVVLFTATGAFAAEGSASKDAGKAAPAAKQAPGPKFAKLKLGMSLKDVIAKIGEPTKRWQHPTGKAAIPFYFGPDRWVIQCSYTGEGLLTFNSGESQALTEIQVNRSEGKEQAKAK